jgi:head-tail adaptor
MTRIGDRRTLVSLQNPSGPPVPDGDGGSTQPYADCDPSTVLAAIRTPTVRDLERMAAGTVISTAMRILTFPFHKDVTTKTQLTWTDVAGRAHTANVTGVDNPEDRCIETVVLAVEVVA